jgi:thioredoxin reductase
MHDVIIVGGSYAGMSAALQLARARRSVLVIDAGERRNRFADESHGFLAQDGAPPSQIAEEARRQLLAYPTVEWVTGRAVSASGEADAFKVGTDDGGRHQGRRLVLASGVSDVLPEIPGLADQWGAGAFGCPYCHAYELGGEPVAVIATGPASLHHATMVSQWGPTTLFTNGAVPLAAEEAADLARREIIIDPTPIMQVRGPRGTPAMKLEDGRTLIFAGLFVTTSVRLTSDLPRQLACALNDTPIGSLIKVDSMQATSRLGVFACGDAASPMASLALAVGSGAMAGAAAHRSLVFPESLKQAA